MRAFIQTRVYCSKRRIYCFQFKCCGLYNYVDFKDAKEWRRSRAVVGADGQVSTVNLTTPIACCKLQGDFPNVKIKDDTCALKPTNLTSNWMTVGGFRELLRCMVPQ